MTINPQTFRKPLVLAVTSALLLVVYFTGALNRLENQAQDLLCRVFGLIHPNNKYMPGFRCVE